MPKIKCRFGMHNWSQMTEEFSNDLKHIIRTKTCSRCGKTKRKVTPRPRFGKA